MFPDFQTGISFIHQQCHKRVQCFLVYEALSWKNRLIPTKPSVLPSRKQPNEVIVTLSRSLQAHSSVPRDISVSGFKSNSLLHHVASPSCLCGERTREQAVSNIAVKHCFCGSTCLRPRLFNSAAQVNLNFPVTSSGLIAMSV